MSDKQITHYVGDDCAGGHREYDIQAEVDALRAQVAPLLDVVMEFPPEKGSPEAAEYWETRDERWERAAMLVVAQERAAILNEARRQGWTWTLEAAAAAEALVAYLEGQG